jgi:type IV secretion system protein VirD4
MWTFLRFLFKAFLWLLPFLVFFWLRDLGAAFSHDLALSFHSSGSPALYAFFERFRMTARVLGPGLILALVGILYAAKVVDRGKVSLAAVALFASAGISLWVELSRLKAIAPGLGFFGRLAYFDHFVTLGVVLAVLIALIPYIGLAKYRQAACNLVGFIPKPKDPERLDSALFGSARFQTVDEMKRHYPSGGVILGEACRVDQDPALKGLAYDSRDSKTWGQGGKAPLLRYEPGSGQSSGHGLNIGGAGSGKSTASAIPTALEWPGALVCFDPAREIWSVTKRDRESRGRKVYVLDPEVSPMGCNLLSWIDRKHPSHDLDNVASWLAGETTEDKAKSGDFWKTSSRNLVKAILAYILLSEEVEEDDRNLRTFAAFMAFGQAALIKKMRAIVGREQHQLVVNLMTPFVGLPDETWGGQYAEAANSTTWTQDERLLRLVAGTDFDLAEIVDGNVDVFMSVKSSVAKMSPGVVRVLLGSIMKAIVNAGGMKQGRCLFLVDEAASLGFMSIFLIALAEYRKFKISLLMYYQSIGQIETQWGKPGKATWFDNSTFLQVSAVSSYPTAKEISDMMGTFTALQESDSESTSANRSMHQTLGSSGTSESKNRQAVKRFLMHPEEVMGLRLDEQIIFRPGQSPIRCGKAFYYRRDEWKDRVDENPYA